MTDRIVFDRETDGRWIAEAPAVPGAMAYGRTVSAARRSVRKLLAAVRHELREVSHD